MKKPAAQSTLITVLTVSLIMAILNSIAFFMSLAAEPTGGVYLGTIHYWEDYFFYLNHFWQGAHGAWLTVNRFTPETTTPTIIYWSNVLSGKLWGFFGMSPILAYNVTIILSAFFLLITAYVLIRRILRDNPSLILPAFLMATLATSLQNRVRSSDGRMIFWPFQIWKTPHFAFDRLGGAPHQMVLTILAYLTFLAYYRTGAAGNRIRSLAPVFVTALLLASIQPAQAAMIIAGITGAEILLALINKDHKSIPIPRLTALIAGGGIMSLYMLQLLNLEPQLQTKIWEASQQSYTTFGFLLLSLGPVAWLAVVGLAARWRKLTGVELAGALIIAVGYAMFMSPLPKLVGISNVRLLFPANYVFWGVFAAYGLQVIARKAGTLLRLKQPTVVNALTVLFVLVSLPTLVWEVGQKLPKPADRHDRLVYMHQAVLDGFAVLSRTGSPDDTVVADPETHMDSLVPGLSGHTTYSGHMLATIDNAGKQAVAGRFFRRELDAATARAWLAKERVRYVFFTRYDSGQGRFEAQYPFLKRIFDNGSAAIYSVQ